MKITYLATNPNRLPLIVAITTTRKIYTIVFRVPNTLLITSIFGKLKAGPANRRANAVQSTAEKIRENTSITIENKSKTDTVSVDNK